MSKHLHLLIPGVNVDPNSLSNHTLASARLRLGPACRSITDQDVRITAGDQCPNEVSTLLVGKIGGADIEQRSRLWLDTLTAQKRTNCRVVLDYTDHHLTTNSVMTPFYKTAIGLADTIAVPTTALAEVLKTEIGVGTDITVVEDFLEYPFIAPKQCQAESPRGLWFGHPSNAEFLAKLIDNWPLISSAGQPSCELLIVSTKATLDVLQRYPFRKPPPLKISFTPWSTASVQAAAKDCDFAVIPSDPNSPKRFASNNRLITALALGLPTAATPIPSYQEFSNYFSPLDSREASNLLANPVDFHPRISDFQRGAQKRFSEQALLDRWREVLV